MRLILEALRYIYIYMGVNFVSAVHVYVPAPKELGHQQMQCWLCS